MGSGEIVAIAEELMFSQTIASTRRKSYAVSRGNFTRCGQEPGVTVPLPSCLTMYRLLNQLGQKHHFFDSTMTRKAAANSYLALRHIANNLYFVAAVSEPITYGSIYVMGVPQVRGGFWLVYTYSYTYFCSKRPKDDVIVTLTRIGVD